MHQSDTGTRHGNEPTYCKHCGYSIGCCNCTVGYIDFLDEKFEQEQYRLFRQEIKSYIHNNTPSIIHRKKNMHSVSGCKGIALLKRLDKR